jgi:uncharacterized membrane protein YkoI
MRKSITYTSSIKKSLMAKLTIYSKKYNLPKNKIIEMALSRYFGTIKKTELKETFMKAGYDKALKRIREL